MQSEIPSINMKHDESDSSNNRQFENNKINDNLISKSTDERDSHSIDDKILPLSPLVTLRNKQKTKPPLSPIRTLIDTPTTLKSPNTPVVTPILTVPAMIRAVASTTTALTPLFRASKSLPPPEYSRIEIYEKRPLILYIPLQYEIYKGNRLLGMEHGIDGQGRLMVREFAKHPETGENIYDI
jgi:hypothetical protein